MRENKKKAGRIVRQLHDRYETYGNSDIGS